MSSTPIEVFIAYAHEDKELLDGLAKQLGILKRQGLIKIWHDRDIGAGTEWGREIYAHLNTAELILLLVSPDFIASEYCYGVEVKRAMERHDAKEARVIPIIFRRVHWKKAPFGKLQALPTEGKPVTSWHNLDEAFFDIVEGIRKIVEESTEEPTIDLSEPTIPLIAVKQTIPLADPVDAVPPPAPSVTTEAPSPGQPEGDETTVGPARKSSPSQRSFPSRWWGKMFSHKRQLALVCCVLLAVLAGGLLSYGLFVYQPYANSTCTPTGIFEALSPPPLRVVKAPDGHCVGISNGIFAFDTKRADAEIKSEAAEAFSKGDTALATSKWEEALQEDTNDAEAGIYLQDQLVRNSGQPYITFIVVTTLTGDDLAVNAGRDMLQGAYVVQKENNDLTRLPNQVRIVLLVANVSWASSGCPDTCANSIVSQIVQAANADPHIKGVIGWPSVSPVLVPKEINELASAGLPVISTTSNDWPGVPASSFFHVAPTLQDQASAAVHFATADLHVKTVALFSDPDNFYSSTLTRDFKQQFEKAGGRIVYAGIYTVNHPEGLKDYVHAALQVTPDLIYFAGYARDVSQLIVDLQLLSSSPPPIMGADALYSPGGYMPGSLHNFNRLYFSAAAFPDEWPLSSKPAFFAEYAQDFDPGGKPESSPYGYTRPDAGVMLSYDAMQACFYASSQLLTGDQNDFSLQAFRQTLSQIQDLQGTSGLLNFTPSGFKAVVVLRIHNENNMFADPDLRRSIVGPFSCPRSVEVGATCSNS